MKRNAVVLAIVAAIVSLMIYAGARNAKRNNYSAYASSSVSGTRLPAGNVKGKIAPDFTLEGLDGKTVKLSDFHGKAVLLNFWATWCGPCKIEMPWFVDLQKQYGPQGLEIIGVAMDDSGKESIQKFAKEMGVNYTIVQGREAVGDAYGGVLGLPTSFFIDRSGKIIDSSAGLISRSEIEDNIKKALATQITENKESGSGGQ
jgi:thiol-disulfide isomerase/thioredoxin